MSKIQGFMELCGNSRHPSARKKPSMTHICWLLCFTCGITGASQQKRYSMQMLHTCRASLPAAKTLSTLSWRLFACVDFWLVTFCNAVTAANQVMAEAELLGLVDITAGMMSARGNRWRIAFSAFCFRSELLAALAIVSGLSVRAKLTHRRDHDF